MPGKQSAGQFFSQQQVRCSSGGSIAVGEKNAVFQEQAPLLRDSQSGALTGDFFRLTGGDDEKLAVGYRDFLRQQHRLSQETTPGGEAVHKGRDGFLPKPLGHQLRRAAACAPNINTHCPSPCRFLKTISNMHKIATSFSFFHLQFDRNAV